MMILGRVAFRVSTPSKAPLVDRYQRWRHQEPANFDSPELAMPESTNDRAALRARAIPHMTLSSGTTSSMTGPPAPMPHYLTAEGRAIKRFAVGGIAILTGGAGTLALVTARALLEHGLEGLALFDLDPSQAKSEITDLKIDFPTAGIMTAQVDVTDAEQLHLCVEDVAKQLGSVDILICFAGVVGCTHAVDMSAAEWKRTLDINTTGAFLSAQAVARQMVKQGTGGSILFTASISAHRTNYPQPQAAYNASKAALISLKSSLAAEWAVHGIRVNSMSPGYMDTILNAGDCIEEARRTWAERNPMGRMGMPEELSGIVVLLCSGAGTYINGADFVVDGGQCCF